MILGAGARVGWRFDRPAYSDRAKRVLTEALLHRRLLIILPTEAERGPRFNSDGAVLARVESHNTEAEFLACPGLATDAALIDAAQSDWWYSHEKDYGTDETEIADEEIEDE